jgi:hypothetical protein
MARTINDRVWKPSKTLTFIDRSPRLQFPHDICKQETDMQARQEVQAAARYMLALEELGLDWHWDGREPVRAYIEREHPHLLRVYDAEFLANAIEGISNRAHA